MQKQGRFSLTALKNSVITTEFAAGIKLLFGFSLLSLKQGIVAIM
jgi:hypothetical protein